MKKQTIHILLISLMLSCNIAGAFEEAIEEGLDCLRPVGIQTTVINKTNDDLWISYEVLGCRAAADAVSPTGNFLIEAQQTNSMVASHFDAYELHVTLNSTSWNYLGEATQRNITNGNNKFTLVITFDSGGYKVEFL